MEPPVSWRLDPVLTAPVDSSWAGSRSAWDSAEPDLVAVGVDVGDLAHAIRVRLPLRRLQPSPSHLGHQGVEVIDDDGVHGVAGVLGPLDDVHRPVLGQLPHGLGVVGEERGRGAEQPLVPGQRRRIVVDGYAREQVDGHAEMLRGCPHPSARLHPRSASPAAVPALAGLAGGVRPGPPGQNCGVPANTLVGRRLVTGALCSAVDAAVGGAGGVVLLAGEAGMGKTALASEAVAYAKAQGAVAVWGTCWEGDGAPGFWPWIQVVRGLARDGSDAGEAALAELTGAAEARGGILGDESAVRFRTYDAAATYLRGRAALRPLVVVVDDLHWADVSSLRLLVFLARQLHDTAALVIGTYRDVEVAAGDHPARQLLAELAGQAESLQLTGLTADEVGQLVEKVCGEPPPTALVRAVHDRTAGNPFFAQQIARLLAAQGAPLDRAPVTGVPPAVGDVLARRLARLSGDVVDLLAVAAVAGQRFPIAMAAAIAGTATETAVRLADQAVRAAVLEHDDPGCARFSHDLFREVLYDGLPAARRSELHLALAGRLERRAGAAASAAEIAHHRSMAWPLGDRDRAIAALVEAGREATARTAFDEAAAHLRRAVEVAGGAASAGLATLCEYGDALRRAGRGEDAQAAFFAAAARARAIGDGASFARAAFGAHRVATLTESSRSGVIALLEEALATPGGGARAEAGATRWL